MIENPEQQLTVFHHDLPALAIGHEANHAFARTCPERSSIGRFYRHCPNAETREAAFATSIPCARHSSKPPEACAWSAGGGGDATTARYFKQISDLRPFCVGQATGVMLFRQLKPVCLGVAIRFTGFGRLEAALGPLFNKNNPGQLQGFCERVGMSGDARFGMKCLRQSA